MNLEKVEKLPPPPGVLSSLRAGFDVVSSHVWLILLPILFDSVLWLGPRLSVGTLYESFVSNMLEILRTRPMPEAQTKILTDSVTSFGGLNWVSWMRTFPVGISSLDAFGLPDKFPLHTPVGLQAVIQLDSFISLLGWTFVLTLIGWIGGSLYFRWVSMTALGETDAGITPGRGLAQTVVLSLVWMLALGVIMLPVTLVLGAVNLVSPILSNGILFVLVLLSYWLIVPLFFTPHGIFARKQNAFHSMYTSLRMSRFTFPSSGMFVLTIFVVTRGLNYLWNVPTSDSWMKLVGIFGHAFTSTTLLAASFVYYRDINGWLQIMLEQLQRQRGLPTQHA